MDQPIIIRLSRLSPTTEIPPTMFSRPANVICNAPKQSCWIVVGLLVMLVPRVSLPGEPTPRKERLSKQGSLQQRNLEMPGVVHKNQYYGPKPEPFPRWNSESDDNPHDRRYCDVYRPSKPAPATGYPTVIVIHGGAWISGDKWMLQTYCHKLADAGIAAVAINYRLAPKHHFPAQADDVRQTMVWVRRNAAKYSFDRNKLGMFGYSAGGHLTLLIAALADESAAKQLEASEWAPEDPRWKEMPILVAVCGGGPPCDFETLPMDSSVMAFFLGGSRRELPSLYRGASPLAHVSAADPPTFLIQGDGDLLVPIESVRIFLEKQKAHGIETSIHVMPNQGHVMTFINPRSSDLVTRFFVEQLRSEDRPTSKHP